MIRPLRHPDDLPYLENLFQRCRNHSGRHPLSEHKYRSLRATPPSGDGVVLEIDGEPAAYVHLLESKIAGTFELEMAVDPAHQGDVERGLLDAAIVLVEELGGDNVYAWVYFPDDVQPLRDRGFEPVRNLHQLRVELPRESPPALPGLEVRGFRDGDADALLALNNRAFVGHPEAGNWSRADLDERRAYAWYDAEGVRMAWLDGRLVAFCWTKVHADGSGEIYLIATDPRYRGRGYGRMIALEGLRFLAEQQGSEVGLLYVDAANEEALGLYRRLGFTIHHTEQVLGLKL